MLRVIGHRGARTLAVENSLQALKAAVDAGADGVEIDVQLSADGEPVVFHDDDLLRLCGAPGLLWQHPWRQLRDVRMAELGLQPQPIAHLDNVLEWWLSAGVLINVELKVAAGLPSKQMRQLVQVVARRLREMPAPQLVVSSFSRPALEEFADLAPHVRCAALIEPAPPCDFWPLTQEPLQVAGPVAQLHPHHSLLDQPWLKEVAQRQWPVWAWTANRPAQWEQQLPLAQAGLLHGLISDHPQELRAFIERHAPEMRAD